MTYTILKKYKDLDQMIENLNRTIKNKAVNSYYLDAYCGVQKLASNIIDLMETKQILLNIKWLIDGAVDRLNETDKEVFRLRYIMNKKTPAIAEIMHFSNMQAYRVVQSMPKKILPFLEESPYFKEFCNIDYNKINYIKSAYEHYSEKLNKKII